MLPKYKLLTTLYLCQRFGGSTGLRQAQTLSLSKSSPPSADIFRHLLGTSYGQTVSRLLKDRFISQVEDVTAITYLGTNALLSHYPLLDYFQPVFHSSPRHSGLSRIDAGDAQHDGGIPQNDGDGGKFTIVVFNIPEEKRQIRDRLRYVLKSAGFGQINRSLYLSPHLTVKEAGHLLSTSGGGFAFSVPFESFKEIDKETLTNFWDLEEVGELYEQALALKGGVFLSKFLEAFGKDPFLPALLLPNNWPGRKALEVAKDILTT